MDFVQQQLDDPNADPALIEEKNKAVDIRLTGLTVEQFKTFTLDDVVKWRDEPS